MVTRTEYINWVTPKKKLLNIAETKLGEQLYAKKY